MTPLQPNNKCLTSVATGECLFVAKARADLGVGPGGPAPPPLLSGIFFFCKRVSDVQYGIQAFAKFKRPECTRLHLRELSENFPGGACAYPGCQRLLSHARKTSGTQGSMRPKLPTKCTVLSPVERYRAHIATEYSISGPPLSQNPPYAPVKCSFSESKATVT